VEERGPGVAALKPARVAEVERLIFRTAVSQIITAQAQKDEAKKPSLLITREEGCEAPKKFEYKPGEPIETLCAATKQ